MRLSLLQSAQISAAFLGEPSGHTGHSVDGVRGLQISLGRLLRDQLFQHQTCSWLRVWYLVSFPMSLSSVVMQSPKGVDAAHHPLPRCEQRRGWESAGVVRPAAASEDTGPRPIALAREGGGITFPISQRKTGAAAHHRAHHKKGACQEPRPHAAGSSDRRGGVPGAPVGAKREERAPRDRGRPA